MEALNEHVKTKKHVTPQGYLRRTVKSLTVIVFNPIKTRQRKGLD